MRVDVTPPELQLAPGQTAVLSVEITNTTSLIESYGVRVLGLDPQWVHAAPASVPLFPGSTGFVTVVVTVPATFPAGRHGLVVQAYGESNPHDYVLVDVPTSMVDLPSFTVALEPPVIDAGRTARLGLLVVNTGNVTQTFVPEVDDVDGRHGVSFDPDQVQLGPGEQTVMQLVSRGRRPWFGTPEARQLTVWLHSGGVRKETAGTILQRARIPRGLVALAGLLVAATVFAAVVGSVFADVVGISRRQEDLLVAALTDEGDAKTLAADPTVVGGSVKVVGSSQPVAGATVQAYPAADSNLAVATAATGDDGTYELRNLAPGAYRLRFTAAGFREVWYPSALAFETAAEVEVSAETPLSGIDVGLGGQPGIVGGKIVGDDPAGAMVRLVLPASALGSSQDAQVATAEALADGSFRFEKVPAPAEYRLEVSKAGYAHEAHAVKLGAAEERQGIEVLLRKGGGSIAGVITSGAAPLGGVNVEVTDGVVQVATTSLTTEPFGSFAVRDLATPGTYTLTFTFAGYRPQVLTVKLNENQELTGLAISLADADGSISGTVRAADGSSVGGVTVTATNGEITVSTTTLSIGQVGVYTLVGLPSPSTFTVSFAAKGYVGQSRSVDLDSLAGADLSNVDVFLAAATARISGTVSDSSGLVGGVKIQATSGPAVYNASSANEPLGSYQLPQLPPGTYTVTFARPGSALQTFLVSLAPGEARTLDVLMTSRAAISGRLTNSNGTPVAGAEVRLYRAVDFPEVPATTIRTGNDGTYVLADLNAPESYVIEFAFSPNSPGDASLRIDLGAGEQRVGVDHQFAN